jgi:RNA polymerase sigma-70 factor (ECF subfamily)
VGGISMTAWADGPEVERRLAEAAAAGDEAAFVALFETHRREVYRIASAVTGDAESAKDALQETFLKVYEGLPRWRGESTLRTWIFRIAIRAAIDQRRRAARHRPAAAPAPEPAHDPTQKLADGLALQRVQALAERLPGQQGLILRLRLLGALDNGGIAAALGLSPANVRMQLSKAVRRLRELL